MVESDTKKDLFLNDHPGFRLCDLVEYPNGGRSEFYENGTDMIIIDEDICNHEENGPVFRYMLITEKQNLYMNRFQRVFRFLGYDRSEVDHYLSSKEIEISVENLNSIGDRGEQTNVSPLEMKFEQNFTNAYGRSALRLSLIHISEPTRL